MKTKVLWILSFIISSILPLQAQTANNRYIEVTGTSELEIVPDEIHYIIEIKEYTTKFFVNDSNHKGLVSRTSLSQTERKLRNTLNKIGIPEDAIRVKEITSDHQHRHRNNYMISKMFDITLKDFNQINEIKKKIDTDGISAMYVGELKNKDILTYHRQGKIDALQAAKLKATYLANAMGEMLGRVIHIIEPQDETKLPSCRASNNKYLTEGDLPNTPPTIKLNYSMLIRFEILEDQTADNVLIPAQEEKSRLNK